MALVPAQPMAATAAALLAIIAVASPVIAVRERLHFLEDEQVNEDNVRSLSKRLTTNAKLKRQLAVTPELRGSGNKADFAGGPPFHASGV